METLQTKNIAIWNFIFSVLFAFLVVLSIYILKTTDKLKLHIPLIDFVLLGLATFRLTHLFVYDYITGYIRDYFDRFKFGPGKTFANLLSCPWCTGIWIALFVTFFYFLSPLSWHVILVIALAGVGIFLEIIIRRLEKL